MLTIALLVGCDGLSDGGGAAHAAADPTVGDSAACEQTAQSAEPLTAPCRDCRILLSRMATLTGRRRGYLEQEMRSAARMRDGRLLFVYWRSGRPVYAADIGRDAVEPVMPVGDGPGEVRYATEVHRSWTDSLLVYDAGLLRMNVLSPSGSYVRSFPANGLYFFVTSLIQLRGGLFVVAANIPTPERAGVPLHLVDPTGAIVRSFGADEGPARTLSWSDDDFRLQRRLVLDTGETFVSVRRGSYVIERWSEEGERLASWDAAPDWFTPKDRFMARSHEEPPPPEVSDVQMDGAGRVWTLVRRADDKWQQGVAPPERPPAVLHVVSPETYLDTQVEVFDGASMERLASVRFDLPLWRFVAPGIAATTSATVDDQPVTHLWCMQLRP